MDIIVLNDLGYQLVPVTKQMLEHIKILSDVDCFDLCDIFRLEFTQYSDKINHHLMKDGTGYFFGCICR